MPSATAPATAPTTTPGSPATSAAPTASASAPWPILEQPNLAAVIEAADYLMPDDLGPAIFNVVPPSTAGAMFAVNPDGKTWDVLLWYYRTYTHKTRVYIVDFSTMQVTRQNFTQEEGHVRIEQGFGWWGARTPDGTLYGPQPDTNTNAVNIYRYNAADNRVELAATVPDLGGERAGIALSPDGWLYGTGTWVTGPDAWRYVGAYGYNPATGEVKSYGPVGPPKENTAFGYTMGCDDTHIYIADGQIPWYLVAVEIKTGKWTVLDQAPEGVYPERMRIIGHYGGAEVMVQKGDDAPKKHYWLYHGQAIPKEGDTPPWADLAAPTPPSPPKPELYLRDLYPDQDGRATLWWRPADSQDDWQSVRLEGVEKHPLTVHRMARTPDGRIWGATHDYRGRFLYDPATGKVTELGAGGGSIYAVVAHNDKLYWSGYPSIPIFEYDPKLPWTLERLGPPGTDPVDETAANPRRVDRDVAFRKTRVKKVLAATVGGDAKVYFGGKGQRDYEGGGLAWYDPKTGQTDGLWEPFYDDYGIGCVTPACDGRYIVASTSNRKVFVFDTHTATVIGDFEPVPGAAKGGPLWEVAHGRMLGITDDPDNKQASVLYGVEVPSGKVLFRKPVPYAFQFTWSQGTDQTDFQKGPDGFIWTYLGNALVRIDPADARVEVVGKVYDIGTMCFDGDDLYVTGTTRVRRYTGIVKQAPTLTRQSLAAAAAVKPVPESPAGAPTVKIELEAEQAELTPPMIAVKDPEASGGQCITTENEYEGLAVFEFELTVPGRYVIWARTLGPSQSGDSMFALVDNGTQDVFDLAEGHHNRWHWRAVNGRGSGGPLTLDPRVFPLDAGQHRLVLRGREPNARVDRLIVTNDLDYRPPQE